MNRAIDFSFRHARRAMRWTLAAVLMPAVAVTFRLLPSVTVTGRSVFGRKVRQGVRKKVLSSCNPPESVSTKRAALVRVSESR